ncbi:DUF433 domain-containing protein [Cylindrospermum sp. FACHB-282]|uniref:DUF433 domain-containing protein n=1 Tax=Cylindrospermum sp. FACHB-282 TaxID=2692794 RepID=UPI0016830BEC|nr:DUF433 domain-containing protein [Cylindrospermum sp. FACHB-282]MBD2384699.1 DUF433 domain-containing protein [Cylindrospermum sp. FACHB-282]
MQTLTNIATLIVSTEGNCGGRPRITDTRITVQYIVNETSLSRDELLILLFP